MVLMFLIPATLSYERTGTAQDGAAIGLRLPVRLVGLGGAQPRAGYVAGFLEATLLVGEGEHEGTSAGRWSLGARAFHGLYRGFGPHVEAGVMADARADVGLGAFVGGGVSFGDRLGSLGLDYRYLAGSEGHAHHVAISYMLLLPFE
jgi:hypothetical protein